MESSPVQEVVLVEVGDPGGDLACHPLQLQEFSFSIMPVLLGKVTLEVTLQYHTHTHTHFISHKLKSNKRKYMGCVVCL